MRPVGAQTRAAEPARAARLLYALVRDRSAPPAIDWTVTAAGRLAGDAGSTGWREYDDVIVERFNAWTLYLELSGMPPARRPRRRIELAAAGVVDGVPVELTAVVSTGVEVDAWSVPRVRMDPAAPRRFRR